MKKKLTQRQMINAELAARAGNKKSTKVLKHHIPVKEQDNLKIAFSCECANPDCIERIMLTLHEYESLHKGLARFVVIKGHVAPKVEKVEKTGKRVSVVKKYALS